MEIFQSDEDFFPSQDEFEEFGEDPWGQYDTFEDIRSCEPVDKAVDPRLQLAAAVLKPKEKKLKFYVTFGQGSPFRSGYWVVWADDDLEARKKINRQFKNGWSMMYTEKDFKPEYFPEGQLGETK